MRDEVAFDQAVCRLIGFVTTARIGCRVVEGTLGEENGGGRFRLRLSSECFSHAILDSSLLRHMYLRFAESVAFYGTGHVACGLSGACSRWLVSNRAPAAFVIKGVFYVGGQVLPGRKRTAVLSVKRR